MYKRFFQIFLSGILLVYFFLKVDWAIFGTAFLKINPWLYLLSTIVAISGTVFMACKYRLLVKNTNLSLPITRLLCIQFISRFYAFFLPTALGSEAVRWYKVTKKKEGKGFFLAATVYERILFLLLLVAFGILPLVFYGDHPQIIELRGHIVPIAVSLSALLAIGLLYLLFSPFQKYIKKKIKQIIRIKQGSKIDILLDNLVLKDKSFFLFTCLICLTICWQLFLIIRIFLLFKSMGLSLGIVDAAWMGSLVLLLQVLPISFAGIGVREGAYAYLFSLVGFPAEEGFLMGVLFLSQMLVFSLIGAVLTIFEKEHHK